MKWCSMEKVGLGEGTCKLTGFTLAAYPTWKSAAKCVMIPGVGCCAEKRLGGYWRKWLKFQGHFFKILKFFLMRSLTLKLKG